MRSALSGSVLVSLLGVAACFNANDGPAPSEATPGDIRPGPGSGPATSAQSSTSATTSTTGAGGAGGQGGEGGGSVGLPLCACISDTYFNDDCEACAVGVRLAECAFAFTACEDDLDCSLAVSFCLPNCAPLDEACFSTCLAIPAASRSRADTLLSCICTTCSELCGLGGAGSCQ